MKMLGQNVDWCVMSPWLFNLFMDIVVRDAREKFGVKLEETTVQLLLFVNDLMLVAEKYEAVERNLSMLCEVMDKLEDANQLTKVLTVKREGGICCDTEVKGEKIDEVKTGKTWGHCLMVKDHAMKRLRADNWNCAHQR